MNRPVELKGNGFIIFDNHMHLSPQGRFLTAVDMFLTSGGSSFNLVNLPDNTAGLDNYYSAVYEKTISMASIIRQEKGLTVPVTLGPYPLDYFRFQKNGQDPLRELKKGVDLAAKYIEKGSAHAIGEIGRPHFPVPEKIRKDSDEIILYCMERASELDCPVILHTDDLDALGYGKLEEMAKKTGLQHSKVVKHHALAEDFEIETKIQRSVLASKSNVRKLMNSKRRFLLETDYVDDIKLGWKVIPPDSVPKRAILMKSEYEGWESVFDETFRNLPISLFGEELFRSFL